MAATANGIVAAIYDHLDTNIVAQISPRWRRQGDSLPYITYEVQQLDWLRTTGTFTQNAELQMAFSCIAETLVDAFDLADEVRDALAPKTTNNGVTFAATQISYRTSDPAPDDGTGDTERTVIVTTTIFAQDEN